VKKTKRKKSSKKTRPDANQLAARLVQGTIKESEK